MNKSSFFPVRYQMVFSTFLLAMIVLFDRILISVAKEPIAEDLSLTDNQMGWILSIFALGYAAFQTPAGLWADRVGPRKVLTVIVSIWSVFTALSGAVFNFISLLIVRFIFGAGEAGAFPSMARAIVRWIPIRERAIVNGINFSGGRIGAAIALPVVAWLIDLTSWRMSFLILGVVGILWAIYWYIWFRNLPKNHVSVSDEELKYIHENVEKNRNSKTPKISFEKVFQSKTMWLLMGQYFASNFTFFFCLTWLFPHLKLKYNLELLEAGFYTSMPLIFGAIGNWFSGWLVDVIYKKGFWSLSRKLPAIIGFTLASVGIISSIYRYEVFGAIVCISVAVFGADMTLSPSWAACVDVGKVHSGTISGTMNMAGNLGSFFTALAFPYLISFTGSSTPFFIVASVLNFIAIVFWMFIKSDSNVDFSKVEI